MHPTAQLVVALFACAVLLVGVLLLWGVHDSQRRQADAAEEANDLHDRYLRLVAGDAAAGRGVHEAETRELHYLDGGR